MGKLDIDRCAGECAASARFMLNKDYPLTAQFATCSSIEINICFLGSTGGYINVSDVVVSGQAPFSTKAQKADV